MRLNKRIGSTCFWQQRPTDAPWTHKLKYSTCIHNHPAWDAHRVYVYGINLPLRPNIWGRSFGPGRKKTPFVPTERRGGKQTSHVWSLIFRVWFKVCSSGNSPVTSLPLKSFCVLLLLVSPLPLLLQGVGLSVLPHPHRSVPLETQKLFFLLSSRQDFTYKRLEVQMMQLRAGFSTTTSPNLTSVSKITMFFVV